MATRDPRIDAYIKRSRPFARPILTRLRAVVRAGAPDAQETVKWGMPAFTRGGRILCGMAGFNAHCALWFWNSAKLRRAGLITRRTGQGAMGQFGRITSVKDLPSRAALLRTIRGAARLQGLPAAKR